MERPWCDKPLVLFRVLIWICAFFLSFFFLPPKAATEARTEFALASNHLQLHYNYPTTTTTTTTTSCGPMDAAADKTSKEILSVIVRSFRAFWYPWGWGVPKIMGLWPLASEAMILRECMPQPSGIALHIKKIS